MALALLPIRPDAPRSATPWIGFEHGDAGLAPWSLAPCSLAIAGDILASIEGDYLTTQVFLDFGRLFRPGLPRRPHTSIALADLARHTRLLGVSLERIAAIFEETSSDDRALFHLAADGSVMLHTATCESVALLCRARRSRVG